MPRYCSRAVVEFEFENFFQKTIKCNICINCTNCQRVELLDFEVERKQFYTLNKDVLLWKIKRQGRIKRLVISSVY